MTPALGLPLLLLVALVLFTLWGGFAIAWDALHPPRKGFAWALATGRPASPEAAGLEADETTLPGLHGVPCPAWHVRGNADALAPTLLVLHGWGRSRWDSLARLAPLLPCAFDAWLPDLPAHGEHAARRGWVGVREPEAVLAMLGEIAARRPGAPIVLVGHSLGAGVALRAAARAAGAPIAGVIALAPYSDLRSPIPGRLALRGLPTFPFMPVAIALLRALGCMDRPLERDVHGLDLPTLVIACEGDRISPVADAEALAQALPRATLLVLPGDRHDEPGAGDPDRFVASVQAFLRSITPTSRGEAAAGA